MHLLLCPFFRNLSNFISSFSYTLLFFASHRRNDPSCWISVGIKQFEALSLFFVPSLQIMPDLLTNKQTPVLQTTPRLSSFQLKIYIFDQNKSMKYDALQNQNFSPSNWPVLFVYCNCSNENTMLFATSSKSLFVWQRFVLKSASASFRFNLIWKLLLYIWRWT